MKCGMGNWTDISTQFVKTKTQDQCEKFYLGKIYVPGDQPTNYEHVTTLRDYTGQNDHKTDDEVQKCCDNSINAFEISAAEFKEKERIEFECQDYDPNFSPLPDQIDGMQQGSRKNNQQQRRDTTKTSC